METTEKTNADLRKTVIMQKKELIRLRRQKQTLRTILQGIICAWDSIDANDQVNEEMNVDEMWIEARKAVNS
jgi:hypothetical protein